MRKTTPKGIIILLLTAVIWGLSFVAQSVGIMSVDAFTFLAVRTTLGVICLLPVVIFTNGGTRKLFDSKTLRSGLVLGLVFTLAQTFQEFAFYYSTAGKIAFITALYMFFVPLIGLLFKKKVSPMTWTAIVIALVGLFLLCIKPGEDGSVNKGDILSVICAVFFAIQIMLIDKFVGENVNGIKLSFLEFSVAAVIEIVLMFIFEDPTLEGIKNAAPALAYSGIMSCGVAYTLQIIGQRHASPVVASLLMCLESVFATISAAVILHDSMTGRELAGCVIMFAAIILSQVSESKKAST